ncbi:MAG: class I SAM-dependent methyltransferase [SAR202 cluster bacterium]|jgi:ubiquinone/menaquinone biosynthesis C-methylase UbiE|nr:methyltransferase type 11 [Chloroflexota bacterium]MDP6421111.1 class I SAM-dependent methyltransferase [SAR202 cluster bacterium]MDP6663294.1 class I SAM-dependent methyltransferase [SAR202 cluster bacterium]MDP6799832.1 class I SAM-dependent methyltransferase [SAR202 cluster bacterium]MQG59699.1 class I SAM-dependent methyltransferase [SAR202 cluster bacterium]|tara:strand:+ start:206 stop:925 length:720 start_codon:yes stop_codon:yes gene_type:complete
MTTNPYDDIAEWYDDRVRSAWGHPGDESDLLAMLTGLTGDVDGLDICDLGCGQGIVSRRFARMGARVVGVDISSRLLAIAAREESANPLGVEYVNDDAQSLSRLSGGSFDGVVCTWSMADIEDLDSCYRSVERILRPGGWFVFLITHPCFQGPGSRWVGAERVVVDYFAEGFWRSENPDGVRGKVGAHHRTLSTYLNGLVEAGLSLERLVEPCGIAPINASLPDTSKVPVFLAVRSRKT